MHVAVRLPLVLGLSTFVCGVVVGGFARPAPAVAAPQRVFELRTYTTHEGKLDDLHRRFRDHTVHLFEKHGMTNVGYWTPREGPASGHTLIYVLAHPDRESARRSWEAFRSDPDWNRARTESEASGPIVVKIDSVFLDATDYSPMH
jgi:hypothetical protein